MTDKPDIREWSTTTDFDKTIERLASAATFCMRQNINGNWYVSPTQFKQHAISILGKFEAISCNNCNGKKDAPVS